MIKINQIKIKPEYIDRERDILINKASELLRVRAEDIHDMKILKKSLDARKSDIFYVYVIAVTIVNEDKILKKNKNRNIERYSPSEYVFPKIDENSMQVAPVVIGMGPAGLFCAYSLCKAGLKPIIIERGSSIEKRDEAVNEFWKTGILKPTNVQFGEGGAGTFSDGKLNTLVKDKYGRNKKVLEIFTEYGADPEITYINKPHIGTDVLKKVIVSMRKALIEMGAQIRFDEKVTGLVIESGRLIGVRTDKDDVIHTNDCVLAIGHSARDTFAMLHNSNIPMEKKPFAVGLRVIHPQSLIDINQYGSDKMDLPASSYKLTYSASDGRGVYSFCMCPGGYVVNASSEEGRLCINGMSDHARDSGFANSAIVVTVSPDDYPDDSPLAGVEFQRRLEEKAFKLGNGDIPVEFLGDYEGTIRRTVSFADAEFRKDYEEDPESYGTLKGRTRYADLTQLLPDELNKDIVEAFDRYGAVIDGFDNEHSLLAGVEARTSSPIRILREADGMSELKGLYPCGEGAGYAGGITSAAMDGLYIAEKIAERYRK
ncbi:MAG: FAD-dependent oxidoreductase [Lachnospiraceae bacterium]|nr:FAD-dependent oxidoreductase [Lachnospiraceae bacterium]